MNFYEWTIDLSQTQPTRPVATPSCDCSFFYFCCALVLLVYAAGLGFIHTLTLGSFVGVATVAIATVGADALAVAPIVGDALEDAPIAILL